MRRDQKFPKMFFFSKGKRELLQLHALLLAMIFLIFCPTCIHSEFVKCDRAPEGTTAQKSPADGRFRIRIDGNPDGYIPGEDYTILLGGIRSIRIVHKFIGFLLVVEKSSPDAHDYYSPDMSTSGLFTLYGDSMSKFSDRCPNAVTQTSAIPKGEIKVNWTAPHSGSGCIVFRATVMEHRDVWYMDDEYLTKMLCEDEQDTIDRQPTIVDPCCACEEAKYELTFERVWSRHTHPKDFPSDSLSTRFSDIIGASHTADYRFWEYGKLASAGVQQVAEHGSTRDLESELKEESSHIRTIIKARGVSQPNVIGKTFAVFRVDSKHHLVSLVTAIDPSPDWIVGVAGLELCNVNCTWLESKKLNLYPWDAGTDSGATYNSPDQPTNPPDVIRRIKPNFPNDMNSPFYDTSGTEMKAMARLHISRQRLYEKNCNNPQTEDEIAQNKACETYQFGEWSECSAKCGVGKRRRNRGYVDPLQANLMGCSKALTEKEECYGHGSFCDEQLIAERLTDYGETNYNDPECLLTEWLPWSSCSVPCGRGHKVRIRNYRKQSNIKQCRAGAISPPLLEETDICSGELCIGDGPAVGQSTQNFKSCRTTEWSEWSPCSKTCGLGQQVRKRHLHRLFFPTTKRTASNNNGLNNECAATLLQEEVVCGFDQPGCESNQPNMNQVPEYCFEEPKFGHCRNTVNQWFYEPTANECQIFPFSGCGGNQNRFTTKEMCEKTCGRTFLIPGYNKKRN